MAHPVLTIGRSILVGTLAAVFVVACGGDPASPSASLAGSAAASPAAAPTAPSEPATASSTPVAPSTAPSASDTAAGIEACALLSGAELATILSVDGVQPRPMPSGGWVASQCAWNGPTAGFFVSVGTAESIAAFGDAAVPDATAKLDEFKKQAGSGAKDLPGVGDGAVLGPTGLAAYQGGTYLQFTNLGLTEDQLIEIATLVVNRL